MDLLVDVTAAADRVAEARLVLDMETAALRQSIVVADAHGAGTRNAIARAASRGLSRKKVLATLAAHDLEEDARAAVVGLPAVIFNDGFRGRLRVRLDFSRPVLSVPASEREAAAGAVVRALTAANIVLSDAEDPGRPFRDDLAKGIQFVTITRVRPKAATAAEDPHAAAGQPSGPPWSVAVTDHLAPPAEINGTPRTDPPADGPDE